MNTHSSVISAPSTTVSAIQAVGIGVTRAGEGIILSVGGGADVGGRGPRLTGQESSGSHERQEADEGDAAEEHLCSELTGRGCEMIEGK